MYNNIFRPFIVVLRLYNNDNKYKIRKSDHNLFCSYGNDRGRKGHCVCKLYPDMETSQKNCWESIEVRERPFNLKEGGGAGGCYVFFSKKIF